MGPEKGGTSAVTIVLPTYNRASFLSEAFTSIERQTFTDWELVVVDDGSTDDTRAMVDRFADSHAQTVRYFFQRNRGPSTARNLGVSHAGSPLVAPRPFSMCRLVPRMYISPPTTVMYCVLSISAWIVAP